MDVLISTYPHGGNILHQAAVFNDTNILNYLSLQQRETFEKLCRVGLSKDTNPSHHYQPGWNLPEILKSFKSIPQLIGFSDASLSGIGLTPYMVAVLMNSQDFTREILNLNPEVLHHKNVTTADHTYDILRRANVLLDTIDDDILVEMYWAHQRGR